MFYLFTFYYGRYFDLYKWKRFSTAFERKELEPQSILAATDQELVHLGVTTIGEKYHVILKRHKDSLCNRICAG